MKAPQPAVRSGPILALVLVSCLFLLAAMVSPAAAQSADPSKWGAKVSFVPGWTMADQVKNLLADENSVVTFDGTEFEIGFVRGSRLGGDWGVSYVRKPFDDGSGATTTDQDCFNQAQTICRPNIEVIETKGVYLRGVEIHWFIRIVNIKQRAQVGLNVGGGIGTTQGQVVKTTDFYEQTGFNLNGPILVPRHTVEELDAKDELFPYFPLFKFEVVGSAIITSHFKAQFAWGANFPSYSPRIMGVVLF